MRDRQETGLFVPHPSSLVPHPSEGTMATDTSTSMDVSIWERIGDGLLAASDGISRFLTRLFGASNERYVRKLGYIRSSGPTKPHSVIAGSLLAQVNDLEPQMKALSDDEL